MLTGRSQFSKFRLLFVKSTFLFFHIVCLRPGVRIVTKARGAYDLWLTDHIKQVGLSYFHTSSYSIHLDPSNKWKTITCHQTLVRKSTTTKSQTLISQATILRAPSIEESFQLFKNENCEVLSGLRPRLMQDRYQCRPTKQNFDLRKSGKNFNGKSPDQYQFSLTGSVWKVRGFCWEVLQLSSSASAAGCSYCTISLSTSFRELKVTIASVWHWRDIVSSNACGDLQEGFAWGSWVPRPVCGQGQAFGIGEKSSSNNHEHKS